MVELAQVELKLRNICLRAIEKGSEEIYLLVSAPPFLSKILDSWRKRERIQR